MHNALVSPCALAHELTVGQKVPLEFSHQLTGRRAPGHSSGAKIPWRQLAALAIKYPTLRVPLLMYEGSMGNSWIN